VSRTTVRASGGYNIVFKKTLDKQRDNIAISAAISHERKHREILQAK